MSFVIKDSNPFTHKMIRIGQLPVTLRLGMMMSWKLHSLWTLIFAWSWMSARVTPISVCYPALFSFGDSKADTGEVQAALPFSTHAEFPPYGQTYFKKPANRFSDGRLVIDFHAQAYGLKFLDPYLLSVGGDFRQGANFAASGGTAVGANYTTQPFNLGVQFRQFQRFKANVRDSPPGALVPPPEQFVQGLYVVSIGENDYRGAYRQSVPVEEVKKIIVPLVVQAISDTLENLYEEGARHFFVVNYCADGCLPSFLSNYPGPPEDYDAYGCLIPYNSVAELHNKQLEGKVDMLRQKYPDARFIYGDYYGINMEIVSNPIKYGFHTTLDACCGPQVPHRYNKNLLCGGTGIINGRNVSTTVCENPSKFVSWDGIHLTEHFYRVVADAFLNGNCVHPLHALRPDNCSLIAVS